MLMAQAVKQRLVLKQERIPALRMRYTLPARNTLSQRRAAQPASDQQKRRQERSSREWTGKLRLKLPAAVPHCGQAVTPDFGQAGLQMLPSPAAQQPQLQWRWSI